MLEDEIMIWYIGISVALPNRLAYASQGIAYSSNFIKLAKQLMMDESN